MKRLRRSRRASGDVDLVSQFEQFARIGDRLDRGLERLFDARWQLHDNELRYRSLLESMQDIIWRTDADGRVTFANGAYFRVFGIDRKLPWNRVPAPRSLDSTSGERPFQMSEGENRRALCRLATSREPRWFDIQAHRVPAEGPDAFETQYVGRDVTELRQKEDELARARDEAQTANRAKSRFLAAMSHEIRTPMNGILGMASLLAETELRPDQKTYVSAIDSSAKTLLQLIDEILDFSKIEAGKLVIEDAAFDVRSSIQGVVELLAPKAFEKGLSLAWASSPVVPAIVLGDESRVRQIVTNLVGNAIKFTEQGGVLVTIEPAGGRFGEKISVSVRDSGIGISETALGTLFSEFEQGDEVARRAHGGTGLGLAISRRLARAMGGDVTVVSRPGKGSVFTATLALPAIRRLQRGELNVAESGAHNVLLAMPPSFERDALELMLAGQEIAYASTELDDACAVAKAAILAEMPFTTLIVDTRREPEVITSLIDDIRCIHEGSGLGSPVAVAILEPPARELSPQLRSTGLEQFLIRPVRPQALAERLRAGRRSAQTTIAPLSRSDAPEPNDNRKDVAVLLVEDNDINALLARRMLESAGCRITHVKDGAKALEQLLAVRDGKTPPYELVLMDVHMPVLDGIEATRRIKRAFAAVEATAPPIIALTANAFPEDRRRCLEGGMDDYLSKPFEKTELAHLLRKWLRPATSGRTDAA